MYVNINKSTGYNRPWQNELPISHLLSGLPELISLQNLIPDSIFESEIVRLLSNIPPLNALLDTNKSSEHSTNVIHQNHKNKTFLINLAYLEGQISSYFHIISSSHILFSKTHSNHSIPNLNGIIEYVIQTFSFSKDNYFLSYPIIDSFFQLESNSYDLSKFNLSNIMSLYKFIMFKYQNSYIHFFHNIGNYQYTTGFNFDGTFLKFLLQESVHGENPLALSQFRDVIQYALIATKQGSGFSSLQHSSSYSSSMTDLQISDLFCKWLIFAALELTGYRYLSVSGVFNERGHLLFL